jgi:hypothetical protein
MGAHGTHFNAIDGFLNHSGSTGGGGKFLKGWKKDGRLYAWLHCMQLPIGLWRHNFPQLIVKENKDTRRVERHIWGQSDNCWEPEDVLKEQNFRNKETKQRDKMPTRCPQCRLIEHVWQRVNVTRDLDFTAPILRFDGADNPKENCIIHAAGIYNGFSTTAVAKFTDAQKDQVAKSGIFLSEAWKENDKASLSYVFTIVNNDKPGDGVQITVEKSSLGDRVKGVINDRIESAGVEAGNPTITPYCIEFTYDEKKSMNEMYGARYIERIKITPEIERLIRSDPPTLDKVLEPFDRMQFRAQLEKHLVADLDLDWIFDVEVDEETGEDEEHEERTPEVGGDDDTDAGDDDGTSFPHGANVPAAAAPPPPASAPAPRTRRKPVIPPEELGDPCEVCKDPMRKTDVKCAGCGTEYEPEDAPAPAAPAPAAPPATAASGSSKPKTCKHCKVEVKPGVNKCPACGKKIIPF